MSNRLSHGKNAFPLHEVGTQFERHKEPDDKFLRVLTALIIAYLALIAFVLSLDPCGFR